MASPTDSMDISLSKLQGIAKGREAGVLQSMGLGLPPLRDWTTTIRYGGLFIGFWEVSSQIHHIFQQQEQSLRII